MRRSTFYDEDLSEVVDLSEHGTWANASICEIIQDLVDALFPLQTVTEGHEERFAALEAVRRGLESKRGNSLSRCLKLPRKNLDIRCPAVPNACGAREFASVVLPRFCFVLERRDTSHCCLPNVSYCPPANMCLLSNAPPADWHVTQESATPEFRRPCHAGDEQEHARRS